jgi:hypothetical protein
MTDLRQMVASSSSSNRHCLQHGSRDNHPDITSAVIQHPPPQQYSDLAAARMSPPSPPYLLKAPPPHHQVTLVIFFVKCQLLLLKHGNIFRVSSFC